MLYKNIYWYFGWIILNTIALIKIWIKMKITKEHIKDFLSHHNHKNQVVNKGGICLFIASLPIFIISKNYIFLAVSFCGFTIGLADDLLKKTGGLNNKLRIILWSIIGIAIACYRYHLYGGVVCIPVFNIFINLKYFYIIFAGIFVFLGAVNGVNFTDGLDGMVTFPLILNFFFLAIASFVNHNNQVFALTGGIIAILMGFLFMNINKAKIFMSDSGSIFLGMLLGSLFILLRMEFFFLITGMIFAINVFVSFIQVTAINIFKKKVFKMAPLHHHFELSGYSETTIVFYTWWFSLLCFFLAIGAFFNS